MVSTAQTIMLAIIGFGILLGLFMFRKRARPIEPPTPTPDPQTPLPQNNPPIAFGPGLIGMTSDGARLGDVIHMDLRHRQAGCDSAGAPTFEYGAYDPDGEYLEYKIEVTGPDKQKDASALYSIFNEYGKNIGGKWLEPGHKDTFPIGIKNPMSGEKEVVALCSFVVGYTGREKPPQILSKACGPSPIPTPPPSLTDKIGSCFIRYWVRDKRLSTVQGRAIELSIYKGCQ